MSTEVTPHAGGPGSGLELHGKETPTATGRRTEMNSLQFTKKALIFDQDMPTEFRRGVRQLTELVLASGKETRSGGELILASDMPQIIAPNYEKAQRLQKSAIASGMRQLSKAYKSGNRTVQRRVGWMATPKRIIISTAERELSRRPDGKLAPSGEWLLEDRRTYTNVTGNAAPKVKGQMADDVATTATNNSAASQGTPTINSQEHLENLNAQKFPEGSGALGTLPAKLRSSAIKLVPAPIVFDGVILQEADRQGNPTAFEINILRMDTSRAIVVQAKKPITGKVWTISQATYELGKPEIEQA